MLNPSHLDVQHHGLSAVTQAQEFVTFMVGRQAYGLPVTEVLEVVPIPALISLAGAAPHLAGLLQLRGRLVPVLDGGMLFEEQTPYDLDSQVVIIRRAQGGPNTGLAVGRVTGVGTWSTAGLTPLAGSAAAVFLGVVEHADGAVIILDVAALVALAPALEAIGTSL